MAFKFYVLLAMVCTFAVWQYFHQWLFKKLGHKISGQRLFLIDKVSYYAGFVIIMLLALKKIGADPNDILATAGVLTVAFGFAAKTSVSHLISGLILVGTKLIKKGDLIEVGKLIGVVENIDIFSTHIRTFDNILVTLPNEKLLTEYVSNYSQYPIRRVSCDMIVRSEDIERHLVDELQERIKSLHILLLEPEPIIVLSTEPGRGVNLSLRAWCEASQFIMARNQLIFETSAFLKEKKIRSGGDLPLVTHSP